MKDIIENQLDEIYSQLFKVIEQKSLSNKVRQKYKREIIKLSELRINPSEPDELNAYLEALNKSSRKFLQATINEWRGANKSKHTSSKIRDSEVISKSYTWLTLMDVRKLLNSINPIKPSDNSVPQKRAEYLMNLQKKVILCLLIGAGLRCKEAKEINWDSIREDTNSIEVYRNGKLHRSIPISDHFKVILDQWGSEVGMQEGPILRQINADGSLGDSMSEKAIARIVARSGSVPGKEYLTPEDLRRGYAQIALQLGHSLRQISRWLGHRNVGETIRYLASNEGMDTPVCEALLKHNSYFLQETSLDQT